MEYGKGPVNEAWTKGKLAFEAADVGETAPYILYADPSHAHPLDGQWGLCSRMGDGAKQFLPDTTPGTGQTGGTAAKFLAKSCFYAVYAHWALWMTNQRLHNESSNDKDSVESLRSLVGTKIHTPLKDNVINGFKCHFMYTAKKHLMDGMCFNSLVASARETANQRKIGLAIFVYSFMMYVLWRRIRDNINVQRWHVDKAIKEEIWRQEMAADGFFPEQHADDFKDKVLMAAEIPGVVGQPVQAARSGM
jgi:hypothetical protein